MKHMHALIQGKKNRQSPTAKKLGPKWFWLVKIWCHSPGWQVQIGTKWSVLGSWSVFKKSGKRTFFLISVSKSNQGWSNYTPGIYAQGYIVFVFPSVCSFVYSFVLPSHFWNYFKVLRSSNSSGVYLTNHSSESIHIWIIGTLVGRLSFRDSLPQGPCPGVGPEVKN